MRGKSVIHLGSLLLLLMISKTKSALIQGGHYHSEVPAGRCEFTVELMFIADASSSQAEQFEGLSNKFKSFVDTLTSEFPGSRVGFGTFVDKPSSPDDQIYCYKTEAELTSTSAEFKSVISRVRTGGGSDQPENLLGAMMRAAMSPSVGWSKKTIQEETGLPIVRILVGFTDAMPHSSDYFSRAKQIGEPGYRGFPKILGSFVEKVTPKSLWFDENASCFDTEYPSFEEWATSMKTHNIVPFLLAGNWTYEAEGRLYFPIEYLQYSIENDRPEWRSTETGLQAFFSDLVGEQNLDGLVDTLSSDLSDFEDKIIDGLTEDLADIVC